MNKKNITIEEKAQMVIEANELLTEQEALGEVEDMIQNNVLEFPFNDQQYRVTKPNRAQRQEIRDVTNKKKTELLRNPENATEAELIRIFLNRPQPIDITKMHQKIRSLQVEIENQAVAIVEQLVEGEKIKMLEVVEKLKAEQMEIQVEISDLCSSCVEKQLKDFTQDYLTYVCLERKQAHGNFVRNFKSYEDFMAVTEEKEDQLIYRAAYYLSVLVYHNV